MRTIAIVNQKGGCGKTTTTVNLAGALVAEENRVLVVDMDPQGHASLALGIDPEDLDENLYEVLAEPGGTADLQRVLVPFNDNLYVAPSGIVLSALEQRLAAERADTRTERLALALERLPDEFDYALIDCPPNVGILTFNALRAASEVIVPMESSYFAVHGVEKLLETISLLADRIGHDLTVRILPTLYDGRTRYARQTLGEIREHFKDMCFDTVIRQNVRLREAARRGVPVCNFAASASGSIDYGALAVEIDAMQPPEKPAAFDKAVSEDMPRREVVVHFRDSTANDVRIAGDFNNWVPDKGVRSLIESDGQTRVWTKVLHLVPGTYRYRYVVDGEWRADPNNPGNDAGSGNPRDSLLVVR